MTKIFIKANQKVLSKKKVQDLLFIHLEIKFKKRDNQSLGTTNLYLENMNWIVSARPVWSIPSKEDNV